MIDSAIPVTLAITLDWKTVQTELEKSTIQISEGYVELSLSLHPGCSILGITNKDRYVDTPNQKE